MLIRPCEPADRAALWRILEPTIRQGETYALDPDWSEADALAYWTGADRETFVVQADGRLLGTYYLRANQAGGGAHVANCGYMTAAGCEGRGVARAMCAHSLERARVRGYSAMQFNFVVSSNERALRLWLSFGFSVVGRLPRAFRHPRLGLIDVLVMSKSF